MSRFNFKDVASKLNERLNGAKSAFGNVFQKQQWRGVANQPGAGVFKWYPRDLGAGLAEGVIGHNIFVANTPQQFDGSHARHFMLIECLAAVPLFCVTTVHYVSTFCLYPGRVSLLPGLHNELANRSKAIAFWNEHVTKLQPQVAISFRGSMLLMQVMTLPLWMVLATTSPAVVHCMLEKSNEILAAKYGVMEKKGPSTIEQLRGLTEKAQEYHQAHCLIKTDVVAAIFLMLFILFLCS